MSDTGKSMKLLDDAIREHNPVAVLGLFSGGHDSVTAVHVAASHPSFTAAVHINTGTGVEEDDFSTIGFVRDTAKRHAWPLREYRAKEDAGVDYEQIVAQYGFPGPAAHKFMYIRLKERALRLAVRAAKSGYKRNRRVILVSGARQEESVRRMGTAAPITREGAWVWVNVIWDWSGTDCARYMVENGIRRSPVVDRIHKSGECLCGAYAKPGEFEDLKMWCPKTAARLEAMRGSSSRPCWGWGASDRKQWEKAIKSMNLARMPMCDGCSPATPSEPGASEEKSDGR